MTEVLMGDAAFCPSLSSLQAMKRAGMVGFAGYLPSPGAYHVWSGSEWDTAASVFGWANLVGLYVPPQSASAYNAANGAVWGVATVGAARALGLSRVALDVEAGMFSAAPAGVLSATVAWTASAVPLQRWAYGSFPFLNALQGTPGAKPDVAWGAAYPTPRPASPSIATMPSLGGFTGPSQRAWQYAGTVPYCGATIDLSVTDALTAPTPPPVPPPPTVEETDVIASCDLGGGRVGLAVIGALNPDGKTHSIFYTEGPPFTTRTTWAKTPGDAVAVSLAHSGTTLYVFAEGPDGTLWSATQPDGGTLSAWAEMSGIADH